jgi:hypothetical protein
MIIMEALHLYCVIGNGMELESGPIGLPVRGTQTGLPVRGTCLPSRGDRQAQTGLDGRQVSAIHHLDLAAVVGPATVRAYKSMKKEEVIPYLFAHQAVIEKILAEHTVVPVKFGTTARDEEEVRRILEKGYPQLRAALEAMEGKIELDVVALWRDLDSILQEIGEEEEIQRARAAIATRSPDETTEERVRIGKMVKARLDRRREERATEIVEALEGLAQDLLPHALLDDRMILNTAVLVERSREGEVGQALDRLNGRWAGRVDFRCVGPLPPYSFSTVEIRRFEAEEVERARRLLGLGERAGPLDVKAAYRRLAHQCHPDKAPVRQGTGERFEEVTEAYRLLSDYCEAGGQTHPGAEATGVIAVKLFRWGREDGVA